MDALPSMPSRATRFLGRPWPWLLLVATLFSLPLLKGGRDLPPVPPGLDRPPFELELPDEQGRLVSLAQLRGHLVVIGELPLANRAEAERGIDAFHALRKRLRGLGSAVVYLLLCHGGDAETLGALLDERRARKPVNVFLLDEQRVVAGRLRRHAGSETADLFLIDRHGRLRVLEAATPDGIDRLVHTTGLLANWAGADPEPEPAPGDG